MKYGNQAPWKRYLASPVALIFLLLVLFVLARATFRLTAKADSGEARLAQAQAEYQKLEQRKADLSIKVEKLSTTEGLESEIRAKYRAVKDGESVAVIIDDEHITAALTASSTPQLGFFRRILRKLGL
jgi:cell division protein FtsB